jgi:hypothetical protein
MALSLAMMAKMMSVEQDDPYLYLLTLSHPLLPASPYRFVRDPGRDIVSNGNLYRGIFYDIALPHDVPDEQASCRLALMNIDQEAGLALEAVTDRIAGEIRTVFASDPDTYAEEFVEFELIDTEWDTMTASGTLSEAQVDDVIGPDAQITPRLFPAFFR